jgi:ABC-type uncharacterized transport system permease subunit
VHLVITSNVKPNINQRTFICYRTYYYYEFGFDKQRVALMAAINSGKVLSSSLLFSLKMGTQLVLVDQ